MDGSINVPHDIRSNQLYDSCVQEYKVRGSSCLFVSKEPEAQQCLSELRLSLITATAVASLVSSFIIGFFANLPMGLAPGMGTRACS